MNEGTAKTILMHHQIMGDVPKPSAVSDGYVGSLQLVLQATHPECCQQACCAMLAGVSLEEIISLVGPGRMGNAEHEQVVAQFGKGRANHGRFIEHFTRDRNATLGVLAREGGTHWLSLADCRDVQYAHAVLLHQGDLYDPCLGMNPMWPWSRYIQRVWEVIT